MYKEDLALNNLQVLICDKTLLGVIIEEKKRIVRSKSQKQNRLEHALIKCQVAILVEETTE